MIALLRGRVASAAPGQVVVDVNGVGYLIRVPAGARIPPLGDEVTLHTHLVVREDALDLYGFTDLTARALFGTLLGVSGVGPKLALAALDTLGPDGLRAAVIAEDVTALTAIPGVGKKGAQRMVLELRERLGSLPAELFGGAAGNGSGGLHAAADPRNEVRQALAALGYGAVEIEQTVARLPRDGATTEQLIRLALQGLTR